jgi:hypothetical protein
VEIARVIEQVVELRRARMDDVGVTVVQQSHAVDVDVSVSDQDVGQALAWMVDGALSAMSSGEERRLVIWARKANRGAVVGVEYKAGGPEVRLCPSVSDAQKAEALRNLAECRKLLEKWGARLFVSSFEQGKIRFVMELPSER